MGTIRLRRVLRRATSTSHVWLAETDRVLPGHTSSSPRRHPLDRDIDPLTGTNTPRISSLIVFAAYEATMRVEKNPTKILLRSDIHHGWRWHEGKYVPDAPHITASYQTPALEAEHKYHTLHGYVAGMQHYLLTRVDKGRTKGTIGDKGWPKGAEANRPTESHSGPPTLLGPPGKGQLRK
ncbi:hypothetical protein G6O67_003583 [Ophiocordyceps sinensis]|uniref:Uncharacterized protein n=1 Tax=Ophiocordyceps sinensis TaxID=72228 RepID=A0A8H4PS60_9HYPO|nr:hypothetical protein G6O67_003583 [Ophiocordyceps sinensis]